MTFAPRLAAAALKPAAKVATVGTALLRVIIQ